MLTKNRIKLLMLLDTIIIIGAVSIGYWIIHSHAYVVSYVPNVIYLMTAAFIIFHHLYAKIFKLYYKVWEYASVGELMTIFKVVTLTVITAAVVQLFINEFIIYKRMLVVTWMIYILLLGSSRFIWRVLRDRYIKSDANKKRTLIVGAGNAGAMIARQLNSEQNHSELLPVAFIDDNEQKQNLQMFNISVIGKVKDIPEIVKQYDIQHIVIAIPSLKNGQLQKIVDKCNETDAPVKMLPRIEDLMTGKVSVSHLKNVEVEDLLGRDPVELDINSIRDSVTKQVILVTGAGGSIGSELCRQLMRFSPKQLILVGHNEYDIYLINKELHKNHQQKDVEIIQKIADVRDKENMNHIVQTYEPKIIYHAAAHKHVPLMEENIHEAVKNNVIGTRNVAELAAENNVHTFVLVSTDKAVNPPNVMGATKRIAEMVIQHMAKTTKTKFVAVRFGNVLGSSGSVIPLFREQIAAGGPVTVTDKEMTRYFMTIPEASRLVVQAGTLGRGGEIFVLDMGKPVKIIDLAKNLIKLSGYTEEEIGIEITGRRPGEKLFEELLNENELHPKQVFDKIYIGKTKDVNIDIVERVIHLYEKISKEELRELLLAIANNKQIPHIHHLHQTS